MTTVITYGTFDLMHEGHVRLLERAKALGDRLIVGVTSDIYDVQRGKLNVSQNQLERVAGVIKTGLADQVVIEEYDGQKINDIEKYGVDVFAIGSDWRGKFDYLEEFCQVVYLERTHGVSSTMLRNERNTRVVFGIVGAGRIARRFVSEARRVSGVEISSVYDIDEYASANLVSDLDLDSSAESFDQLLDTCNAVYIATPHETHYDYARRALSAGKHVLCETPLTLSLRESSELYALADRRMLTLLEAAKTAFFPGFRHLVETARSGGIGRICAVDATFTKLVPSGRETQPPHGGAISEMGTYPLLAILKLMGRACSGIDTFSIQDPNTGIDQFSRIRISYPNAIATATVGIGVKSEGMLVISGTDGYIYAPAPWWKTTEFETRFEDTQRNRKHFFALEGEGLRYEISEFARMIHNGTRSAYQWRPDDSLWVAKVIEEARRGLTNG